LARGGSRGDCWRSRPPGAIAPGFAPPILPPRGNARHWPVTSPWVQVAVGSRSRRASPPPVHAARSRRRRFASRPVHVPAGIATTGSLRRWFTPRFASRGRFNVAAGHRPPPAERPSARNGSPAPSQSSPAPRHLLIRRARGSGVHRTPPVAPAASGANDWRSTPSTIAAPSCRSAVPFSVRRWRTARPGPGTRSINPALNHPAGKRPEGLVALEGQERQVVQGGARVSSRWRSASHWTSVTRADAARPRARGDGASEGVLTDSPMP